mmetsp:Transcript_13355/g.53571  ORF Transcript_13355/g.53571 Transcript_13355/m.53571 type:complete len:222 (+) Transcript_13355:164-829(+)
MKSPEGRRRQRRTRARLEREQTRVRREATRSRRPGVRRRRRRPCYKAPWTDGLCTRARRNLRVLAPLSRASERATTHHPAQERARPERGFDQSVEGSWPHCARHCAMHCAVNGSLAARAATSIEPGASTSPARWCSRKSAARSSTMASGDDAEASPPRNAAPSKSTAAPPPRLCCIASSRCRTMSDWLCGDDDDDDSAESTAATSAAPARGRLGSSFVASR